MIAMKTEYSSVFIGVKMIYIHRAIENFIIKNADSFPCITLYGPR